MRAQDGDANFPRSATSLRVCASTCGSVGAPTAAAVCAQASAGVRVPQLADNAAAHQRPGITAESWRHPLAAHVCAQTAWGVGRQPPQPFTHRRPRAFARERLTHARVTCFQRSAHGPWAMGDVTDRARWFVAIGLLEHDAHRGPTTITCRCSAASTARPPCASAAAPPQRRNGATVDPVTISQQHAA